MVTINYTISSGIVSVDSTTNKANAVIIMIDKEGKVHNCTFSDIDPGTKPVAASSNPTSTVS